MDKDRIDIVLGTDLIVENKVRIIVAGIGEIIKMATITVMEGTEPEMGDTHQTIGIMIDPTTEGKVLIKIIAKGTEIEV